MSTYFRPFPANHSLEKYFLSLAKIFEQLQVTKGAGVAVAALGQNLPTRDSEQTGVA